MLLLKTLEEALRNYQFILSFSGKNATYTLALTQETLNSSLLICISENLNVFNAQQNRLQPKKKKHKLITTSLTNQKLFLIFLVNGRITLYFSGKS